MAKEVIVNTDLGFRVKELAQKVDSLRSELNELKKAAKDELWDNNDMVRNWNISLRTLASWRAEGKIDYIQIDRKIWYTKESRDSLLNKNLVKGTNLNIVSMN